MRRHIGVGNGLERPRHVCPETHPRAAREKAGRRSEDRVEKAEDRPQQTPAAEYRTKRENKRPGKEEK